MLKAFSGRRPSQIEEELRGLIDLFIAEGVRSYAEIGAREGDTFHEVLTRVPRCRGVAVDLPDGLWGKAGTRAKLEAAVRDLTARGIEASCLFGNSQTEATHRLIRLRGPYDAILIDGDHTYEGVRADWENYGPGARLVAFHDIVGSGCRDRRRGAPVEVPRLWAEIKATHRTVEFIAAGSQMGIGVAFPLETP